MLRYAVHELAAALAKPSTANAPISPPPRKQLRGRHYVRSKRRTPRYWAERKRIRARQNWTPLLRSR